MGSPLAPLRHSITDQTPWDGDLLIPQFPHEDLHQFVTHLSTPPQNLDIRIVRLTWINDGSVYRMVRRMPDGKRHGEILDLNSVPTGRFEQCLYDYCNLVKPAPIPATTTTTH